MDSSRMRERVTVVFAAGVMLCMGWNNRAGGDEEVHVHGSHCSHGAVEKPAAIAESAANAVENEVPEKKVFTDADLLPGPVCLKCGLLKGSPSCCEPGGVECPKCGRKKGSLGCCKDICSKCGYLRGGPQCCVSPVE